jgi:hypothetical protein
MQEFVDKEKALELSKEIETVALETNLNIKAAERLVLEQYKKALSLATTQGKEHNKTFNDIITDDEDIDNHKVIDIDSGQTIRDLI